MVSLGYPLSQVGLICLQAQHLLGHKPGGSAGSASHDIGPHDYILSLSAALNGKLYHWVPNSRLFQELSDDGLIGIGSESAKRLGKGRLHSQLRSLLLHLSSLPQRHLLRRFRSADDRFDPSLFELGKQAVEDIGMDIDHNDQIRLRYILGEQGLYIIYEIPICRGIGHLHQCHNIFCQVRGNIPAFGAGVCTGDAEA